MAIVKFVVSNCPMNNIFPYVMNPKKTENGVRVSGIHCTPESALDEFRFIKNKFGKTDGRQYYHIILSFSPDDKLNSKTAHEIGLKFAEYFPGFQFVVATHCIKTNIIPLRPLDTFRRAFLLPARVVEKTFWIGGALGGILH